MNRESIAVGLAGVCFGLLIGYIWGANHPAGRGPVPAAASSAPAAPAGSSQAAPFLDQQQAQNLAAIAEREPTNVQVRVQLGNLYFDAERYAGAIPWYEQAVKLNPNDPNVSTDLGIAYYYTNDPDRALAQFERSLKADPRHTKTLLNIGIVRAFGKQDAQGARRAWQQLIEMAPDAPEATRAREALSALTTAHPELAAPPKPRP